MKVKNKLLFVFLLTASICCAQRRSGGIDFPVQPPRPDITALNPVTIDAGSPDFTLTVVGKNFIPQSVVEFDGKAMPTRFLDSTTLEVDVPAAEISTPRIIVITVLNPAPSRSALRIMLPSDTRKRVMTRHDRSQETQLEIKDAARSSAQKMVSDLC